MSARRKEHVKAALARNSKPLGPVMKFALVFVATAIVVIVLGLLASIAPLF